MFIKKLLSIAFISAIACGGAEAADLGKDLDATFSTDLVSGYIWRGQDMGGVSIQPGGSILWKGLSLSAWGSVGFEGSDTKEVDFTLGYETGGLSVGLTDYWFDNGPGYFKYAAHNTAHVWEIYAGYDFGPVALKWFTNIGGNDGVTSKGKRAYSSYVEVSAPFRIKAVDFAAEVGATPWSTTFYNSHGFAVVNVALGASKEFTFSGCSLTPYAKVIFNPRNDKAYMVAGVSFSVL